MVGNNLFEECFNLINEWIPKKEYSRETKYTKDLRDFLDEKLNKNGPIKRKRIHVDKERSSNRCDISVEKRVGIELKRGKEGKIKKSNIDRLRSQVRDHKEDHSEGVIVVLVGMVNKLHYSRVYSKLTQLKNDIKDNFSIYEYPMKLIDRSHNKIKKESRKSSNSSFDIDIKRFSLK